MKKGKQRITIWTKPEKRIYSEYGYIPYITWCEHEVERMNKPGSIHVFTIEKKNGGRDSKIAIFRSNLNIKFEE